MDAGKKRLIIWMSVVTCLVAVFLGSLLTAGNVKRETTYFVLQNMIVFSYAVLGVILIVLLHETFWTVTNGFLIANSILEIGKLHFLTYKLYHILALILFALSVIYLVVCLVWAQKDKLYKNFHFTNGIIPVLYVGFSYFLNLFVLLKWIETEIDIPAALIAVGLAIAITATIFCAVLNRNRENKKEYVGSLLGVFFLSLCLVVVVPLLTLEHVNYAFDTSPGVQTECTVVQKYTTHNRKSGTGYGLVLEVDGQEIRFNVNRILYEKYQEGETICLYAHVGALHYPYYEYKLESVYEYREE